MSNCVSSLSKAIELSPANNRTFVSTVLAGKFNNFENTNIPMSLTPSGKKSSLFNDMLLHYGNDESKVIKTMISLYRMMDVSPEVKAKLITKGEEEPRFSTIEDKIFNKSTVIDNVKLNKSNKSSSYFMEGLTYKQTMDTVNTMVNDVKSKLVDVKDGEPLVFEVYTAKFKANLSEYLKEYKDELVEFKAELKEAEADLLTETDPENIETLEENIEGVKEDIEYNESEIQLYQSILKVDNQKKLIKLVTNQLVSDKYIKIKRVKKGSKENKDIIENNKALLEGSWDDNKKLSTDYKSTASQLLKSILSKVTKVDALGAEVLTSLRTLDSYPMGFIFDYVLELEYNSNLNVEEMLDILENKGATGKAIVDAVRNADDSQAVKNNFKTVFTTQINKLSTIMYNKKDDGLSSRVIDTNSNKEYYNNINRWRANQMTILSSINEEDQLKGVQPLIVNNSKTKGINVQALAALKNNELNFWKRTALKIKEDSSEVEIKEHVLSIINGTEKSRGIRSVLKSFGVDNVSEEMLIELLTNPDKYVKGTKGVPEGMDINTLFNNSNQGLFHHMINPKDRKKVEGIDENFQHLFDNTNPLDNSSFTKILNNLVMSYDNSEYTAMYRNGEGNTVSGQGLPNDLSLSYDKIKNDEKYLMGLRASPFSGMSAFLPSMSEDVNYKSKLRKFIGIAANDALHENTFSVFDSMDIRALDSKANDKGTGYAKVRADMSNKEQLVAAIDLMHNDGNKKGYFMTIPMSDKSKVPLISYSKLKLGHEFIATTSTEMTYNLGEDTALLAKLTTPAFAEVNRVNDFIRKRNKYNKFKADDSFMYQYNKSKAKYNSSSITTNEKEARPDLYTTIHDDSDFLFMENYNKLSKELEEGTIKFYLFNKLNEVFDIDNRTNIIDTSDPYNVAKINNTVLESVTSSIDNLVDYMKKEEIYDNLPKGLIKKVSFEVFGRVTEVNPELLKDAVIKKIANEFEINTIFTNHNFMMVYGGDPAQYAKGDKTIDNYYKRMGGLSGTHDSSNFIFTDEDGKISDYSKVEYFVADDPETSRYEQEYIDEEIPGYKGATAADAQEWTTIREHFSTLYFRGTLSTKKFKQMNDTLNDPANKGKRFKFTDLGLVVIPAKPLTRGQQYDSFTRSMLLTYMKSSSFGLDAEATAGLDIDYLRQKMEEREAHHISQGRNVNVRLIFKSGAKQFPNKPFKIFNVDNKGKTPLDRGAVLDKAAVDAMFEEGGYEVDRKLMGVQQEEAHGGDDQIVTVSQLNKLMFQGLLTGDKAKYEYDIDIPRSFIKDPNRKKPNSVELKNYKEYIRKEIFNTRKKELEDDFGIVNGKFKNYSKILEYIKEEIESAGSINEAESLVLDKDGNLKVPLYMTPVFNKVVSNLTSLITNRILKSKMKGESFVQGSSVGVLKLKDYKGKGGIMWAKGQGKALGYTVDKVDKDGNPIAPDAIQVVIPWMFKDKDGKPLDRTKYQNEDGTINIDLLPKDMLEMISARIPNQSHSSTMAVDIVGFLPEGVHDLILLPDEVTLQTGSDFDIDHLYSYMFNYKIGEDGKITKETNLAEVEGLQNEYLNILNSIFRHPEVSKLSRKKLDFEDVKSFVEIKGSNSISGIFKDTEGDFKFGWQSTLKEYNSNQGGKKGIALQSNNSVMMAYIEDKDLKVNEEYASVVIMINGEEVKFDRIGLGTYTNGNKEVRSNFDFNSMTQSEAVDNANNKLLDKMGWDSDIAQMYNGLINLTGKAPDNDTQAVPGEFIMALFNQPIVKKLVQKAKDSKSQLTSGFGDINASLSELMGEKEYTVQSGVLSMEELMASLTDETLNQEQLNVTSSKVLELLFNVLPVGQELAKVSTLLSIDTKGVGKDFHNGLNKLDKRNSLLNGGIIDNAENLFNNKDKTTTEIGEAIKLGVELPISLFASKTEGTYALIPLRSNLMGSVYDMFKTLTGNSVISAKNSKALMDGVVSYMKSNNDLPIMEGRTVSYYRSKLLRGKTSLFSKIANHMSKDGVSDRSYYGFLKELVPKPDKNTGNIYIEFKKDTNSTSDKDLEMTRAFESLFTSEDTVARKLGMDLLRYNYMFGDTSNFKSYSHVVSSGLKELLGINEVMRNTSHEFDSAKEAKSALIQTLSHNPYMIDVAGYKGTLDLDAGIYYESISKDPADIIRITQKGTIGVLRTTIEGDFDNEYVYDIIHPKGGKGKFEYDKGALYSSSTINKQGLNEGVPVEITPKKDIINQNRGVSTYILDRFTHNRELDFNRDSVLNAVSSNINYKAIVDKIKSYIPLDTKVEFNLDLSAKGEALKGSHVIQINPLKFKYTSIYKEKHLAEFESVLTHELIHKALNSMIISPYMDKDFQARIARFDEMRKSLIEEFGLSNEEILNRPDKLHLSEHINATNVLDNVQEFIIGVLTDDTFRTYMDNYLGEEFTGELKDKLGKVSNTEETPTRFIIDEVKKLVNSVRYNTGMNKAEAEVLKKSFEVDDKAQAETKIPEKDNIESPENEVKKLTVDELDKASVDSKDDFFYNRKVEESIADKKAFNEALTVIDVTSPNLGIVPLTQKEINLFLSNNDVIIDVHPSFADSPFTSEVISIDSNNVTLLSSKGKEYNVKVTREYKNSIYSEFYRVRLNHIKNILRYVIKDKVDSAVHKGELAYIANGLANSVNLINNTELDVDVDIVDIYKGGRFLNEMYDYEIDGVYEIVNDTLIDLYSGKLNYLRPVNEVTDSINGTKAKEEVKTSGGNISFSGDLSKYKVIPVTKYFNRGEVKADTDYMYLFTDNANRTSGGTKVDGSSWYAEVYGYDKRFPTRTQAVIRGLNNAFPITTMVNEKRTQWDDSKFNEYKEIIDNEILQIRDALDSGEFKGVKFSSSMPIGKGQISNMKDNAPKIWGYLNTKLQEIGIDNTGNTSAVSQVADTQLNLFENKSKETAKEVSKKGFKISMDKGRKDKYKAELATHYVFANFGKNANTKVYGEPYTGDNQYKGKSSTLTYAHDARSSGIPVNSTEFKPTDMVWASISGGTHRYGQSKAKYIKTLSYIKKAMESKATILLDSESQTETNTYVRGNYSEAALVRYVKENGYIEEVHLGGYTSSYVHPDNSKSPFKDELPDLGDTPFKDTQDTQETQTKDEIRIGNEYVHFDELGSVFNRKGKDITKSKVGGEAIIERDYPKLKETNRVSNLHNLDVFVTEDERILSLSKSSKGKEILIGEDKSTTKKRTQILNEVRRRKGQTEIVMTGEVKEVDVLKNPVDENKVKATVSNKPTFSYKGKTIDTDFELSTDQVKALRELIDFSSSSYDRTNTDNNLITLSGAAGTGKTSIIRFLDRYMSDSTLVYSAPTHAAVVELAMSVAEKGSELPYTVNSSIFSMTKDGKELFGFTNKVKLQFNEYGDNLYIIDEASMLSNKEVDLSSDVIKGKNIKVIFMGDKMQIPKPVSIKDREFDKKGDEIKQLSPAFTKYNQVNLEVVHRQDNSLQLDVINFTREGNTHKLGMPSKNNDNVKYYTEANSGEYRSLVRDTFLKDPEGTRIITYKNKDAQAANKKIREGIFNRKGNIQKGDIIVGSIGNGSKQIVASNIANSVVYTVDKVSVGNEPTLRRIKSKSSKLTELKDRGVRTVDVGNATYYQLSHTDSFTFKELSNEDMATNNKLLSSSFNFLYRRLSELQEGIKQARLNKNWGPVYGELRINVQDAKKVIADIAVGGNYIYNINTNKMEPYIAKTTWNKGNDIHNKIAGKYPDLVVMKDVDYGHAITAHKSQGQSINNVFTDYNTLNAGPITPIMKDGLQVATERQTINYVILSRSKNLLGVLVEADNLPTIYDKNAKDLGFTETDVDIFDTSKNKCK